MRHTIILGSGPAGLTAAIYAARANLKPLLIRGSQPGGQLTTTTAVENYPGFPGGLDGPELMERMEEQARILGTEFLEGEVDAADLSRRPFSVCVAGDCFQTRTLIVATGASPRMLGIDGEWEFMGRGVSVCATCDGFFYRDQEVVVVGGGDTAMEEACFLTRFARRVTVVHRRDTLRASLPLQERARANERIVFRWNSRVDRILTDEKTGVTGVEIVDLASGETATEACTGLFIAIGHTPNTALFEGQLGMDDAGYLSTNKHTETDVPGVFACGDVQDSHFRQAVTAAGSGCMAALQAERYLENFAR
ncbi:MAG: thioredoxin-disulfide reductase [Desulfuromonadales bacterium]|nr:thioredoxin-disulfide reductase [Desulfuromonadales bacterium]NIR33860.1 thioredoxin-disulfide reductase [Desulfuromonadales bacterium]NIS40011.1 thioredoxin-disulfide reductase [Desulfuromonadales bacterium]